jgi:hypothetical protein
MDKELKNENIRISKTDFDRLDKSYVRFKFHLIVPLLNF